jgi:hypothetical protein
MYNHPNYDWTVGYLTYTSNDARGQEMSAFWQRRGIPCVFLGYVDDYRDLESQQISFDTDSAREDIQALADRYDLVLTHDQQGDYGHLHHKFVYDCVQHHPRLVTFANTSSGNVKFSVPVGAYDLSELPEHQHIIAGFFPNGVHQNNYTEIAK